MEIIADTRERHPWDFIFFENISVTRACLDIGDYTTPKLKDKVVIERKASPSEIYLNLVDKKDSVRFKAELEKMRGYKSAYIVCEFPESKIYQFPKGCGIPEKISSRMKLTGRALRKIIADTEKKFEIPFVFFENKNEAEDFVYSLFSLLEKKYERDLPECS